MIEAIIFGVEGDTAPHQFQQTIDLAVAPRLDHTCPAPGIVSTLRTTEFSWPVDEVPPATLGAMFEDGTSALLIEEDTGFRERPEDPGHTLGPFIIALRRLAWMLEPGSVTEIAATSERFEQLVDPATPSQMPTEILDLHTAHIEHHL